MRYKHFLKYYLIYIRVLSIAIPKYNISMKLLSLRQLLLKLSLSPRIYNFIYCLEQINIIDKSMSLFFLTDQSPNLMGHRFRVVSVPYYPYMEYKKQSDQPGGLIIPKDSVDKYLLSTIAEKLNVS